MRAATIGLLLAVAASRAAAQSPMAFLDDWRHQQRHVLAVIDSATPTMLDFRTTPGVRTFAQQIDHITDVAVRIVALGIVGQPPPAGLRGDSALYLHDRAALRAVAARRLEWVMEALGKLGDAHLEGEQDLAGGRMTRWRWNMTALQHSAWTLGQLVPYLRMNGRTPPQFTPF